MLGGFSNLALLKDWGIWALSGRDGEAGGTNLELRKSSSLEEFENGESLKTAWKCGFPC